MFWKRITEEESRSVGNFTKTSYLGGLVVTTRGLYGGNARLFGFPVVLYYSQEHFGWFNQWVFTIPFIFALRRIDDKGGTLKTLSNKPAGWSVRFAKLRVSVHFQGPELYQ